MCRVRSQASAKAAGLRLCEQAPPHWTGSPLPLSGALRAVKPLTPDMVPEPLRACMVDIAARMACPLEYPTVACIVALASLIGRKCGVTPKQHDDWVVVPNLWGGLVGAPGVQKTPAAEEALRPLQQLVDAALARHKGALVDHQAEAMLRKARGRAAAEALDKGARTARHGAEDLKALALLAAQQDDTHRRPRRAATPSTMRLSRRWGSACRRTPTVCYCIAMRSRAFCGASTNKGNETARAFFLEAWNGTGQNFIYDRVGRGTRVITGRVHLGHSALSSRGRCCAISAPEATGTAQTGSIQRFQLSGLSRPAGMAAVGPNA